MIARLPDGARQGIVLLHGRGGSGADILSLLDHAGLGDVAAVAPEAPGRSWWPTSFLAPTAQMEPFVTTGLAAVTKAVQALDAAGIPRGAIWLGGFSQGACLALEAFAREGEGLAGVFALSGALVGTADAGRAAGPAGRDLMGHPEKRLDYSAFAGGEKRTGRAWISVHERDPHIPLRRVSESADALAALGVDVKTAIYPGAGHGVMRQDIEALRAGFAA